MLIPILLLAISFPSLSHDRTNLGPPNPLQVILIVSPTCSFIGDTGRMVDMTGVKTVKIDGI